MANRLVQRRLLRLFLLTATFVTIYILLNPTDYIPQSATWQASKYVPSSFDWAKRSQMHPFDESTMTRLPEGTPRKLPRIQHEFSKDELSASHNQTQRTRRDTVRNAAKRAWKAYRDYAWGRDEVLPLSLAGKDTFAGWGATLVDSLDTLWIMDMKFEFAEAVRRVATIDWDKPTSTRCSLFETNIRFLGGLLSAYDLSEERILLDKAIELGEMLYAAFDTPSHMPANDFKFEDAKRGRLVAGSFEASAAVGSLSLEFTRLSQLTGDSKYYNAIDGIKKALEKTQDSTHLPGMWPVFVDLRNEFSASGSSYSLGASADSAYEYLSKMYALLGGLDPTYEKLHTKAMEAAKKHILFRPMLPDLSPTSRPDILFSGTVRIHGGDADLQPEVQHLGCFAGGMFALGGRLFGLEDHVKIGEQLARGCAWAYAAFPTGVMPEISTVIACEEKKGEEEDQKKDRLYFCAWDETRWKDNAKHPKPFYAVQDPRYILRPEAIESVFILYRITGKADLLDVAWEMFESVIKATETKHAYSAISSTETNGETDKEDSMEVSLNWASYYETVSLTILSQSFWIAETLKYFYLIFSEPDLISLDDYVFNTEAHPLRLPKPEDRGTTDV